MQKKIAVESQDFAQSRLDVFLAKNLNVTRNQLKARCNSIKVNGAEAKFSRQIREGDEIEVDFAEESVRAEILPQDIPLNVIFENESAIVINKKQGMTVHPGAGRSDGTVSNALAFRFAKDFPKDNLRPGIVHRLDKDTSGVMICAKNEAALEFLQSQFRERKVRKQYVAVVKGVPKMQRGSVKNYIFRSPHDRKSFKCGDAKNGKFAWTDWEVLRVYGNYSVLRLNLHTGRTHQIRVHLKHLGLPILGDKIYGASDAVFPNAAMMLHAFKLKITLPGEETARTFKAKLPARFKEAIDFLEANYERKF